MIQFTCPRCQTVLSAADEQGGTKINCPKCSQKLLVPQSEFNRTMVGKLMPQPAAAGAGLKPAAPPPVAPSPAPGVSATANPQLKVAEWYYTRMGKQCGPVTWAQLRFLTASNQVMPNERVWTQGMANWTLASSVQGLFPKGSGPAPRVGPRRAKRGRLWLWVGLGAGVAACAAGVLIFILTRSRPGDQQTDKKPEEPKQPAAGKSLTEKEIFHKVKGSIALIKTSRGSGSGFVVFPGVVATNAHVVDGAPASDITVRFPSAGEGKDKPIPVDHVVGFYWKRDLAFLVVQTDQPPLPVAKDFQFEPGEKIVAIGNPGALGQTVEMAITSGVLSSKSTIEGEKYYQVSIAINHGNSGGPILNSRAEVIGVATLGAPGTQQLNFCVPVEDLRKRMAEVEKIPKDTYDQVTSDYNAKTVFRRIVQASRLCFNGSSRVLQAWERAGRAGLPRDLLKSTVQEILADFQKKGLISYFYIKDIKTVMPHVGSDRHLTAETRQKLADLWTNFAELHDAFLNPADAGSFDNLRRTVLERAKKFDEIVGPLKITLGVEDEELQFR